MSSTSMQEQAASDRGHEAVEVVVSFPLAGQGPFKKKVGREATVESVRVEAMAHFGVHDDETTTYYLTHDGARVTPEKTVGEVAGEAEAVKFTLVKELIQG